MATLMFFLVHVLQYIARMHAPNQHPDKYFLTQGMQFIRYLSACINVSAWNIFTELMHWAKAGYLFLASPLFGESQ